MSKRIVLIIMDSVGVGYGKDADEFGDMGSNTLGSIIRENPRLKIDNLKSMGILNLEKILPIAQQAKIKMPEKIIGSYGQMSELSKGKDTTTGHLEIAGLETSVPSKTYADGFPKEFIEEFEKRIGRKTMGNISISGVEIIEKLGEEHEKTGNIIVYTSADSVFQIAANVDIIPLEELYRICQIAREMLIGKWQCDRVIARPYRRVNGKPVRTPDRHDYALDPHGTTLLDILKNSGKEVYAIGKIADIFNNRGITQRVTTKDNNDGISKTIQALKMDFDGLIFVNLVDFDSKYGHRRDPRGYGEALEQFDFRIPEIMKNLRDDDILIISADHGNDPCFKGFNHTRENIPLLVYGKNIKENNYLGIRDTFADISATASEYFNVDKTGLGKSFLSEILIDGN
ncbi:phosphopentomutase [Eubacterium brachy ATCC 33089]|nr:phosphopentomutase [Eubacterium brachy ATCC 33089]